jgi:hypothetical protein
MDIAASNPALRRLSVTAWIFISVFSTLLASAGALAADTTPPSAAGATTSISCVTTVGDACYVNDANFTLKVTPAVDEAGGSGVNAAGYQVCRSNDTLGWGGCDVSLTLTSTTTFVVNGAHRPPPGIRRAYYFRSRDNAGNWGGWNNPIYIQTISAGDITPPSAPGDTSSTQCASVQAGVCYVNPGDFTIRVTAASDNAGGSGVNAGAYNYCRSNDTTGWAGCDVGLTTAGGLSYAVSGTHRPAPGQRRAYYVHARDNAGNAGPWNNPLYVQTLADTVAPGVVPGGVARIGGANIAGLNIGTGNPSIALTWSPASDNWAVARYHMVLQHVASGVWTYNVSANHPATSFTLATSGLQSGSQYRMWLRAVDDAGNAGTFADLGAFTVTIADTTPPSALPSLTARIGGSLIAGLTVANTSPSIAINWGLATDNVAVARYQILLVHTQSGGGVYNFTVNHPTASHTLATSGLLDGGNYSVQVRAIDSSNNNGPLSNAGTFFVRLDVTPPSAVGSFNATLNTRPIGGQQIPWSNPSVDMNWSAASDAGGIRRYRVLLERVDVPGVTATQLLGSNILATNFPASGLVVGGTYRFGVHAQDHSDNWGPVVYAGNFGIAPPIGSNVQPRHEMMITALPIVEDPTRTTGCGAWTFCALMTALAGNQDPAQFTENLFDLFRVTQNIGDDVVAPSAHVPNKLFAAWPRQSNGRLDLTQSPLRLLAIVNRADLVRPGDAGEARMVFGFRTGVQDNLTVILEYRMSLDLLSRAQWWSEWHRLAQHPDQGSEGFRSQLQFLTDKFARTPVNGKISLGQLRTNDGLIFASTLFWEFREFMQPAGNARMVQTTVKQTPRQIFNGSTTLGNWINSHEAEVLSETHEVSAPLTLAGADFIGGFLAPNTSNPLAGMLFSKNSCSGCHIANSFSQGSGNIFYQIPPRSAGQEARLSDFFFNRQLCGDSDEDGKCLFPYTQNELGRRENIFEQNLGAVGFFAGDSEKLRSEVFEHPMREPSDEEVVTLDSLSRVH